MMRTIVSLCATAFVSLLSVLSGAQAAYVSPETNQIVAEGTSGITVRFDGVRAGHSSNLIFSNLDQFVLNNQSTSIGATFSLGQFAAGEVLRFELENMTSGFSYFTGLASDNVDNFLHAILQDNGDGSVTVFFEDLFNGGDRDYYDLVFTVIESPLPGAMPLILSGIAGLLFASRQRRRAF